MKNFRKIKVAMIAMLQLGMMMSSINAFGQQDGFFMSDQTMYRDGDNTEVSGIWGNATVTDSETGEVPLGNGLLVLAAAAGLYLIVRTSKTRRAMTMMVVAVALTFGMTQCRKAPLVSPEKPETGETISIYFTAGGEAAKTDINCTNGQYTWNAGDKIYVVCKNGKLSGTDKVVLLGGYLEAKMGGQISSVISGTVTLPANYTLPAKPIFSFYYVGSQVSFTPQTGGTNLTFNIADQFAAGLNDAGEYQIGRADTVKMRYDESLSRYVPVSSNAKTFRTLTSTILLNTEVSGGEFGCPGQALSMFGDKIRTIMNIDLSNEANPTYTAGTITFASRTNSQISLLPTNVAGDNTDATFRLTGNNKGAKLTVKNGIKAGRVYVDLVGDIVNPVSAIAQATTLSMTTNSFGCSSGVISGLGGSVTPSSSQTCEYGVVYSKSSVCSDPYIGVAGCSKEIAGNSMVSFALEFNIDVLTLDAETYAYKTYAIGEYGNIVYGPVKTVNGANMPRRCTWANGESPKSFALRAGGSVKFSKGNLQWSARGSHSTVEGTQAGTWRFAEYQYDIRGAENSNISSSYTGWIDLFGYGTSGKNHHPYDASDKNSDYINRDIYGTYYDWGVYNDISNDGYGVGAWRTLKENGASLDFNEWRYVIRGRGDDSNFGFGKIGGCTNGMIILPDGWSWPSNDLKSKWKSGEKSNWDSNNNYTCVEWTAMENAGAVFLPAAGWRKNTTVNSANSQGYYMSSAVMLPNVYRVYFYNEYLHCSGLESRCYGMGVRLVR